MKAFKLAALLGAVLVTASELVAFDYGTQRIIARSPAYTSSVLLAQE